MEVLHSLLSEAQNAQQNEDFATVEETLSNAIQTLETLSQNCTIEPIAVEETTPSSSNTTQENELTADKQDGFYLVGIDIMPGRWETTGSNSDCFWARTDVAGDTLDNHFGQAGGTITVHETDFQVEFNNCGIVVYVENREPTLSPDAEAPKDSGFYTVGVEIAPGLWRSTGDGDSCYVARLDENQDPIDNNFGNAGITVNIQPTDYEVEFNDCGTWEYLGNP